MESRRFDALVRALAVPGSRRRALALALGGVLAVRAAPEPHDATAHNALKKCKKKSGKQRKKCVKKAKRHNRAHAAGGDPTACQPGASESCYSGPPGSAGVGECRAGTRECEPDGTWGACAGEVVPTVETCDLLDNDCDGVADNGFDLQNDASHCGECGNACGFPNATAACSEGECVIAACDPGFADCDGIAANGCETQLGTPDHCAACGDGCGGVPNTTATCAAGPGPGPGTCVYTCEEGFADCNGSMADGCEVEGVCS